MAYSSGLQGLDLVLGVKDRRCTVCGYCVWVLWMGYEWVRGLYDGVGSADGVWVCMRSVAEWVTHLGESHGKGVLERTCKRKM